MDKFRNSYGRLTAYALACGYVESKMLGAVNLTMWSEHGVFHVRAHNHGDGRWVFWDTFRTLTDARRRYDRASRAIASAL